MRQTFIMLYIWYRDKTAQVDEGEYVGMDRQMNTVKYSTVPLEANSKDLKATTSSDQKAIEATTDEIYETLQ